MQKKLCTLVGAALTSVLVACGGGDQSSAVASGCTSTMANPNGCNSGAEGAYGGNLSGSRSSNVEILILENGDVWAIYGTQTTASLAVAGFVQGSGTANNGTYSSSDVRDFGFSPAVAATVSATYNSSAKTISGSLLESGGTVTFNGGPIAGSLYNYDTAASLSSVLGNWSLVTLQGEGVSLNVASSGAFTATTALGCSFSGSMAPRASGKNVFNVSLNFGPAPCALAGQAATGIGLVSPLISGRTQLIFAGFNFARTVGTMAFGTR